MIVGIGTDIIEIDRVLKASENSRFLNKYFTEEEILIFQKKRKSIAGNFAVKESVAKMFGTGFNGFSLKDIEVLRDENGRPYVNLYNEARNIAKKQEIDVIHVSMSDNNSCSIAYVVGEKWDK